MFTGIIETLGVVKKIEKDQENLHVTIQSDFTSELNHRCSRKNYKGNF